MGLRGAAVVGLLFPGQGSQYVGMGRDLAAESTSARQTFEEADAVLGFALTRICFEGPDSDLTWTANAQPAILTHSIAIYRAIADQLGPVRMAAGHSLGELSAYVAAGAFSFADGLRAVRLRGELMAQSGNRRPGTMAALIGMDEEAAERLCRDVSTASEVCVPANINAPGQVVVSGDVAAIDRALSAAKDAGARRALRLNVSGAFHSPLMEPAKAAFQDHLERSDLSDPAFPVVSNATAQPVTDAHTARDLLIEQLTSPVRWTASMQTMLDAGVNEFVELGPGSVLSGLLKRIARDANARAVGTAADLASVGGG